jgi:hypothetical protein
VARINAVALERLRRFFDENGQRLETIVTTFGTYQPQPVTRDKLWDWLRQFDEQDCDLLIRLVERVNYYDIARINALLRELHRAIRQQLVHDGFAQTRRTIFVPAGGAGESGQEIFRRYRDINRLAQTGARLLLVPELPEPVVAAQKAREPIAIIFLDDFIGTGTQIRDYWNDVLTQVIPPPVPAVYFGTVAATGNGVALAQSETPLKVITAHYIPAIACLSNANFSADERDRIRTYCMAIGNQPFGFGDIELLLAFSYGCPNNTISLLCGAKGQRRWKGILPRFNDLP